MRLPAAGTARDRRVAALLTSLLTVTAGLCAACVTPAGAAEQRLTSDGTTAWLTSTPATGGGDAGLTVELEPPTGFRNAYFRLDGSFLPGDEASGGAGLARFADLGLREPAEQTPELILTYRTPDALGRSETFVTIIHVYRNVAQGTQCGSNVDIGPFQGALRTVASAGSALTYAGTDLALTKALGVDDDTVGPLRIVKVTANNDFGALTTDSPTTAEVRRTPELQHLVEQHAAETWAAYERSLTDPSLRAEIRRGRLASWYADQVLLGLPGQADDQVARESGRLDLLSEPGFRDKLAAIRKSWATNSQATLADIKGIKKRDAKPRTINNSYAFTATLELRNRRAAAIVTAGKGELIGRPAIIEFRYREGGHGPYKRSRRTFTLGQSTVVLGPRVRSRETRMGAELTVPGLQGGEPDVHHRAAARQPPLLTRRSQREI